MAGFSLFRTVVAALALAGFSLADLGGELQTRQSADPCAAIAGQNYTVPSKLLACLNSFTFDTTLRDNIVDVVSKSLNFHTSTNYQRNAPFPFVDVHVDVQGELARIKGSTYQSDYELHKDVSSQLKRLFDGHCTYINYCYDSLFVSYLPFPLVNLNHGPGNLLQSAFIAPEAFDVVSKEFAPYIDQWQQLAGFNFTKYSGAKVLLIDDTLPLIQIEKNAQVIGGYQGHSTRQNSFFSSYIRAANEWSYRMGDFAARSLPPTKDYVKMTVVLANSTKIETIKVPFISRTTVSAFTSGADLWDKNCKAKSTTNGVDYFAAPAPSNVARDGDTAIELVDPSPPKFAEPIAPQDRKHPISSFIDVTALTDITLPPGLSPPEPISGNGTARFYLQGKVGVLALGSFSTGAGYEAWFNILNDGLNTLKTQGATHLIVDVTNNGGGYICVANYLHRFLAGPKSTTVPQAGFDTEARYNTLASNITQVIASGGVPEREVLLYDPVNWSYANSSGKFPENLNWLEPPVKKVINGQQDAFSQRLGDECQPFPVSVPDAPFFPPENIGIVNNGRCASSCSIFTITMAKLEGVKTAVVGGITLIPQQYSGTVGGQSTSFTVIDSEIKSTKLKSNALAPPDFIGNAYQGITWRLGFGFDDKTKPEEWQNHMAKDSVPLTLATVNRPEAIWKELTHRWWPNL
ncbi:hypothetical protein M408DRAFT_332377 [Serendipita vermifera MAFF 305830]|uniref:Tail specific protease domain-containing protein n=1 Tax=Serendipita vermifera MAFF 305830 TaxID=933852 RepID=A0A0C3AVP6_SERVB|nr:hypothetical protein M408DRAFT_332377 [Serendipita vermifera MAFF 305830]